MEIGRGIREKRTHGRDLPYQADEMHTRKHSKGAQVLSALSDNLQLTGSQENLCSVNIKTEVTTLMVQTCLHTDNANSLPWLHIQR